MSLHHRTFAWLVLLKVLLVPDWAVAQSVTTATIAGAVKDATGAVLPGVTVEASSPALIEKTRAAVTDAEGNYKILELRPGTYVVRFTLAGFSTVQREGLELATGFTASVNVEMKVGGVEETLTVTGATPVVDVQNVRTQQVLSKELWEAIPTGKNLPSYIQLTVGATVAPSSQDVGGIKGDKSANGSFTYHGAGQNDSQIVVDGMNVNSRTIAGIGAWTRTTVQNQLAFEEQTIGSGVSAEQENAGLLINMVPRDGGNMFSGNFALNGSGSPLQGNNLTPDLVARGVPVQGKVQKLYDAGFGLGGPIKRDRLWFYFSDRTWNAANIVPGAFANATPQLVYGAIPVFTPDLSRPAVNAAPNHDDDARVTWQINNAQKVSGFVELQSSCNCQFGASSLTALEASQNMNVYYGHSIVSQATWTYVKGNRWLFSAGNSTLLQSGKAGAEQNTSSTALPLIDQVTGFSWNARADDPYPFGTCCTPYQDGRIANSQYAHEQRYSATYSTGSHTFKVGGRTSENGSVAGTSAYNMTPLGPVVVQVRGGVCLTPGCTPPPPVPAAILLLVNPQGPASTQNQGGNFVFQTALYAQEQWTLHRMTLNLGVRYDGMRGRWNTYTTAANNYAPSITFPAVPNSPNWNDLAPRIGVAYDLFGNGKTAIKGSWGRFVTNQTAAGNSPSSLLGYGGGVRTWNDSFYPVGDSRRGNFLPDCDLTNPLANGECGPLPNVNRGLPTAPSTFYDNAFLTGWFSRPYQWSSSLSVQQELRPGIGVTVGYFRTTSGNIMVTDNRAVVPSDYTQYCVPAPTDPRLGSVSGSNLCGLYDVNPLQFGLTNNLITTGSKVGVAPVNQYDGVDALVNARFGKGGVLSGGVSSSKTVIDNITAGDPAGCFTLTVPARPGYCSTVTDWQHSTQIKAYGNYPLPWWGLQASATFQNLPGPPISASKSYTNAQIAPSLGRNLSAGPTGTVSIALLPPNSVWEPRFSETDVRLTKAIRIQRVRAQGQFDIYNLFNSSAVLADSASYSNASSVWPRVSSILGARLFKFGVQLDWR
ncbi:MAG TPA: carboxypeptidase regulatory-like domain-containing protein [Vicinamibacterales bacterium]|jgi:hypothetical protein|nr:carboxypeptidase regulatory-like domain-containing protein [Vicinamibacterales bacterium]